MAVFLMNERFYDDALEYTVCPAFTNPTIAIMSDSLPQPPAAWPASISQLVLGLATGLGLGFAPVAPGTCGAMWGIPLAWGICMLPGGWPARLLTIAILFIVGIPICTHAARRLGGKDPGAVVFDEIATVPLVFLFVDARLMSRPDVLIIGFCLHRLFDISKPPPVCNLERLPDGLGIMSDDVAAGFYACGSLQLLLWLWPWLSR